MIEKVLTKMEVKHGFIHIPAKSRLELVGNAALPCVTTVNGYLARVDRLGRLWSPHLKGKFLVGAQVRLNRIQEGVQIENVEGQSEDASQQVQALSQAQLDASRWSEELRRFEKAEGSWLPKVILGDIRKIATHLPDNSVDCIVTSPPYWMQRDYTHPDQIGREETPEEYANEIADTFRNLRPKLKKTATIFLNVGYKYLNGELLLIPEMIALKMRSQGFVLKNKIIWWKPNAMPTPARDRLNDVYEPVLFFIRDDGKAVHFFDLGEVAEKSTTIDSYTRFLSIEPQELLGARMIDPFSTRVGNKGKVVGVRYTSNATHEILVLWDEGSREWLVFGNPMRNYPESPSYMCPHCNGPMNRWDVVLSFANSGILTCPTCGKVLCKDVNSFPLPLYSETEKCKEEPRELINLDAEARKYITRTPKSSKFIKAGMEGISMSSPAGRLAIQGEYITVKRRWDPPQPLIAEYLRYWRELRSIAIEEIDKVLGYSYTAGHWFRKDYGWWGRGGSIPRPNDWSKLKNTLRFNDIYDELLSKKIAVLQTVRPHEEGKNLGDVWRIVLEQYSGTHFSIFPTKLVETAVRLGCPPGGVVLDPFAGSGTVGEVTIGLGRKAILIELLPEFLDLMKKRCKGRIEVVQLTS
jgi:DNA modification methylase